MDGSVETSFWQNNCAAKRQLQQTVTDLRSEQCRYFGIMNDVSCRRFQEEMVGFSVTLRVSFQGKNDQRLCGNN